MVGACAINSWERSLPVIWTGQKWKIILPGAPEELRVLHKYDWFSYIEISDFKRWLFKN